MGGSGGGGGAGQVSWPDYLQETHDKWLTGTAGTGALSNLTDGMTTALDTAVGADGTPYPQAAYEGTTETDAIRAMVNGLEAAADEFTNDYSNFVANSNSLFDTVVADGFSGALDPMTNFDEYDPTAYELIRGDWSAPVLVPLDWWDSSWTNPLVNIADNINQKWELYPIEAWNIIEINWESPGQLLTPDPNANTGIVSEWSALGEWEAPSPTADAEIVQNWGDLEEWIDPVPLADTNIVSAWSDLNPWIVPDPTADVAIDGNWNDLVEWVDPTLNAADDITTGLATEAHVAESTNEFGNVLDDQITSDVLPRFEAGMRDINAVMSSAFVIGKSLIEGMRDRDVAKYQADLRYKAHLQRDALLGQAYMQDDQINSTSVLEENRANLLDVTEKNKSIAQAYLQNDQLLAQSINDQNKVSAMAITDKNKSVAQAIIQKDQLLAMSDLEKNRSNVLSVTEQNKMLAQAYLQNDQLLAQSVDGKNKTEAMALTERNKLVAQALLQDDQLLATNVSEKNKIYAGDLLDKQKSLAQSAMQTAELWTNQIVAKASAEAGGITDEGKISAANIAGRNESLVKIALNYDQIFGEHYSSWNKAVAEAYIQGDRIRSQGIETKNKIVSDDYKTKNVIISDYVKNKVLTVFQLAQAIFDSQALGLEYRKTVANMQVEGNRINYVINKEANDKQIELDVNEARWDLDVFQPAANLLAAVSGGTGFVPSPTPGASALGGAFSGAAIGARVSNNSPIGAGAGAVLGGIGGYLLGK